MSSSFKNWLKKSGIKYSLARGRSFQGQEMIDSLDPLDRVIEHPKYRLARIYRDDIWTGIIDTYHVLLGNHYDLYLTGGGRKGVLDLLIFPVISRRLIGFAYANEYHISLSLFAGIIGYVLEIPRGLLAISLTLALSPVVAFVHGCAYSKKKKLRENLHRLKIAKTEILIVPPPVWAPNLLGYDHMLPLCLFEGAAIELVDKTQISSRVGVELGPTSEEGAEQESKESVPQEDVYLEDDDACYYLAVTQEWGYKRRFLANINEENANVIGALLATNTGNILNKLKQEDLPRLQQWIKEPPTKRAARKALCMGALPPKNANAPSTLSHLFNDPQYDKNLVHLVFDMAGIAPPSKTNIQEPGRAARASVMS
ncbi:MAG: hypothetical protein K0R24_833 [Gammaproteobacteria bacterium]|jgi:hypothetical protein|nr:hypothetical protein [Gammaproteobacteria bacterium]